MTNIAIADPKDATDRLENEAAMARLWAESPRMCDVLECADGARYKIVHPGVQNSAAGPDFRGAVLVDQDGHRMTGDIELHLAARDWYSHGHHRDGGYNGVVLHVVINRAARETSRQSSGVYAPIAVLSTDPRPTISADAVSAGVFDEWDRDRIGDLLDSLGDQRFLDRGRGFRIQMESGADPDQCAYESVLETMGYSSNTKPFRQLANAVPYAEFSRLVDEPAGTRVAGITALLANAGGLMGHMAPGAERRQLERLARKLGRPRKTATPEWRLFHVRPVNHPANRLRGAAALLARTVRSGLSSVLAGVLLSDSPERLTKFLQKPPFIGLSGASETAVNVVLPHLFAMGATGVDQALCDAAMTAYREAKVRSSNGSAMRFARSVGIPTDRGFVSSARRQQGVLHL
ncbi:MAG: DUF2851 family protein [SAR202 cluster bacterium]|nr:DUF2851 family protein [SAR202 cluster bacterium]